MRFSAKPNALGRTRTTTAQHKSRYSSQLGPEPHRSSKELSHENQRLEANHKQFRTVRMISKNVGITGRHTSIVADMSKSVGI
ncbi:hypothetical protein TWF173_011257 [Orbilia oligospora]|nr:hypothetical protein TWF173_011257 [Orbilia oligospora]KAF3309334.1 hypothetical protein TWF173_011257 [Orbilia oligospora]